MLLLNHLSTKCQQNESIQNIVYTVNYDIITFKIRVLQCVGITSETKSYLLHRTHCVKIGGNKSKPALIKCGISQRSVLAGSIT